jgi:dephospho-CoA kinase
MDHEVHRVALTGGIATGKSYVSHRFRDAGVPVVDADRLAHDAVRPGTAALDAVRERFGVRAIAATGEMDRRYVADVVFRDPEARRDLEAIIHPVVRREIEAFFDSVGPGSPFAVADIPLLYETGRDQDFEAVVVAACSPALQIARVIARDRSTREDAERRMRAQWPIDQKAAMADYVIRTDGTFEETNAAVTSLIATLTARWT